MTGKKDSANYFFEAALDQTKHKNAGILYAVAIAQLDAKNGDPARALELLEKAAKRDKHNPAIYVAEGNAYRKLANGSESYKAYKKALEESPSYAAAYHNLGEIFLTQKSPDLYLGYFNQAVAADSNYAPSLYKLYAYNFYHDPALAFAFFNKYLAKSDPGIQNRYDLADLFYLNKDYNKALEEAQSIVATQPSVKPRLYKLMSYSYAGLKDTSSAIAMLRQYFQREADSNIISKDYESLADFYATDISDSSAADSAAMASCSSMTLALVTRLFAGLDPEGSRICLVLPMETDTQSPLAIIPFTTSLGDFCGMSMVTFFSHDASARRKTMDKKLFLMFILFNFKT